MSLRRLLVTLPLLLPLGLPLAGCSKPSAEASDDEAKPSKKKGGKVDLADDSTEPSKPADSSSAAASAGPAGDDGKSANGANGAAANADSNASTAVVQEVPFGTVAWTFEADGVVKADVRDKAGGPIREGFAGSLEGADGKPVELAPIEGAPVYGAELPAFKGDLTPVSYVLQVGAEPVKGTLYIPAGGTAVMLTPPSAPPPREAAVVGDVRGPHGGLVQMVGPDRIEVVSDQDSGEVRAYVLDASLKPVVVGERRLTIGVVADHPELLSMEAAEGGAYFSAGWGLKVDPVHITLAVRVGAVVSYGVVGWRPGVRLVTVRPEPWRVRLRPGWGPPARVLVRGRVIEPHEPRLTRRGKVEIGVEPGRHGGGEKVEIRGKPVEKIDVRGKGGGERIEIKGKVGGKPRR